MATAIKQPKLKAAGPLIGVAGSPEIDAGYEALGLTQVRPYYTPYAAETKALPTVERYPDPKDVTTTAPETIQILHEIPVSLEPTAHFEAFVKGAAVLSSIVPDEYIPAIKQVISDDIATKLANGDPLPGIDTGFAESVRRCEEAIFRNGESISWGDLIGFAYGMYWLLSYVAEPRKRKHGLSPLEFVEQVVLHYAALAYLPQG